MESEVSPGTPDYIPAEFVTLYGAEARMTIHAKITPPRSAPSAETLDLVRACLIGLTGGVVILISGFGLLYLTMVARGLVDIVVVAGLIMTVLWIAYFAAAWRAANRYRKPKHRRM